MKSNKVETVTLEPPTSFLFDKKRVGWRLDRNVILSEDNLSLELSTLLKQGESAINGQVFLERVMKLSLAAGQLHAERLLGQQDLIPEEWQSFILVFPGTIWFRNYGTGNPLVPYLSYYRHKWHLSWFWFALWGEDKGRIVCSK